MSRCAVFTREGLLRATIAGMKKVFGYYAALVSHWVGTPIFFVLANLFVAYGLVQHGVADTNVFISILTMDIALSIQATQNKDSRALHAKLDALLEAIEAADEQLERVEDLTEEEIERRRPK